MPDLVKSLKNIQDFQQGSLKSKFAKLEAEFRGIGRDKIQALSSNNKVDITLIHSALDLKKALGQINEVVHAVGILLLLPKILKNGEVIESLSLGAGNTGKDSDLVTNMRISEFKFIHWKGGAEAIRQNQLFKDFFYLAEANTNKKRCLYVIGLEYPLKFLEGNRAINSVCSRNAKLSTDFYNLYGDRFSRVCEYYKHRKHLVEIIDINDIMPSLVNSLE